MAEIGDQNTLNSGFGLRRKPAICYTGRMTKDQVKAILDRVLSWPPERQADVAQMVEMMEAQDRTALQLSDEQIAEVERRLSDPDPKFMTLEEVRIRFADRRA